MVLVPGTYASKQQLGETRQQMTKDLMKKDLEPLIDKLKNHKEKYYILVHAKPFPNHPNLIKKKVIALPGKPNMMLSCMLFGVDNKTGTLTLEWALPGDWPTWAVNGTNEPVPETIASIKQSGIHYHYDDFLA